MTLASFAYLESLTGFTSNIPVSSTLAPLDPASHKYSATLSKATQSIK